MGEIHMCVCIWPSAKIVTFFSVAIRSRPLARLLGPMEISSGASNSTFPFCILGSTDIERPLERILDCMMDHVMLHPTFCLRVRKWRKHKLDNCYFRMRLRIKFACNPARQWNGSQAEKLRTQ